MGNHDHSHGHDHSHSHSIKSSKEKKALGIVLVLTFTFMIVEAVAGFYTSSLALLSDAGHMLTDVFAVSLAFFAIWFTEKPPTSTKTFGFYRAEILAAFFNSLLLFAISIGILLEAYKRLLTPHEVKSVEMTIVAVVGLLINLTSAYVLFKYQSGNLNIKGALYHVLSDALGSVGAIVAGIIMITTKWYYADSLISILVSILIIRGAWVLFKESSHILLEGTPKGMDIDAVQSCICSNEKVISVHDLHVWTLTQGFEALSAHIVVENMENSEEVLSKLKQELAEKFNISHITLQLEIEECDEANGPCYDNGVSGN
ncbi:MAG: cation transporter [Thermodesulfobacteriota bacterium]|nr:MAG: cation transporter [Thermodesulfobacteriota bacterium]